MTQYGRVIEVRVGQPGATPKSLLSVRSLTPTGYFEPGFAMSFSVRRTSERRDDVGEVVVHNPGPEILGELQDEGFVTQVLAGYGGQRAMVLTGKLVPSTLNIRTDRGTQTATWRVTDGGVSLRSLRIARSWRSLRASAGFDWVIETAGLTRGVIRLGKDHEYARAVLLSGTVASILSRLARDSRSNWSMQDGRLNVWPKDEQRKVRALTFSPRSGLIGEPRQRDKRRIEISTLLAPSMRPGDLYVLEGVRHAGRYIAEEVHHDGESGYESRFTTQLVGRRAA
jgi:hypothetical protein